MKKYIFNDETVNNLVVFLNRVEYKGLEEVEAINRIMTALNSPETIEKNKDTQ